MSIVEHAGRTGQGTRKAGGKGTPLKALAAVLAVVVAVLYVTAAVQVSHYAQGYSIDYDVRDYLYSAENGRYGDLYDTAVHDMNKNAPHSAEVDEYRALAFYYEQAVLERAYRDAGDDAKADAFAERMADYESQLGSLAGKAAAVRQAVSRS